MKRTVLISMALVLSSLIVYSRAQAQTVEVELINPQGEMTGHATLTEQPGGVGLSLQAWKLSPGPHGFHIHSVGACTPPAFLSARGHFNPHDKKHGLKNPDGAHAGDLPNLVAGPDGIAAVEMLVSDVTLGPGMHSLLSRDGSALVIHASPDDEQTDPAGNAGPRIACGVISSK